VVILSGKKTTNELIKYSNTSFMTKDCLYCGNPIVSKRSTKKYCSDNCKQLAFYKRTQSQLISAPGAGASFGDSGNDDFTLKQTLNDDISFDDWDKGSRNEQVNTTILHKDLPPDRPINVKPFTINSQTTYQWVESSLITKIAEYIDGTTDMLMFQNSSDYWSSYYLPVVKWVSLRLRCLLENLIRLNNYPSIDFATLATIKEAFTDLMGSDNFKRLPSNYPNTGFIKELQQKLSVIVKQHKPRDHIRFRLTQKLKVEIIAKRFMMADFVPFVKFFDLDFGK
jgi:hypothetical protein